MKGIAVIILWVLLAFQGLYAQGNNVSLRVQSPDGKTVKLAWTIKNWNKGITGFDIRRLDGAESWVKLNKTPILPEINSKKDLSTVESDKIEAGRVKSNMLKLIAHNKIKEADNTAFLNQLNSDKVIADNISQVCMQDYDFALMSGFAFVDHTIIKKLTYTYGLFIDGSDSLLAKAVWNYGSYPDLNVVTDMTTRVRQNTKAIELIWEIDTDKADAGSVIGYYIYRNGIRLNQEPLMTPINKDSFEYKWTDAFAHKDQPAQYSISAVSLFGIEGSIRSYNYNIHNHTDNYIAPSIPDIYGQGYYIKEGILINWDFRPEQEKYLKGFYIEKNNLPEGFKKVSGLISPSGREYIDKSPSPLSSYICFRVVALYNDKALVYGNGKIYSYFPAKEPPKPQNLQAIVRKGKNDAQEIVFNWDSPFVGDSVTAHYRLYLWDSTNQKYVPLNSQKIKTNNYTYEAKGNIATNYRFCITAVSKVSYESAFSDPVFVETSSTSIPIVNITKLLANLDKVNIEWEYPAIPDLKGFRVFMNKVQIAGEQDINKEVRKFMTLMPEDGASYEFTIQAVSESGILSEISPPSIIVTTPSGKKGRRK